MHIELTCRCGAKAEFTGEQRESISLGLEVEKWQKDHALCRFDRQPFSATSPDSAPVGENGNDRH